MNIENSKVIEKINSFLIFDIIKKNKKENRYLYANSFLDKEILKLSKEVV